MATIGIDARLTYYRTGGISTYTRQIVRALEHIQDDHRTVVFHSRKGGDTISTRFQRVNAWTPAHHRFERWALSAELLRHRLDLFHSTDFIPPQWGAKRFIITVHDLTFLHYPQYLTSESRQYYNQQITWAVRHAHHIFAVSEATRIDLITMLHVPADKITVHPEGVDSRFQPMSSDDVLHTLRRLQLPSTYILHVGTIEPRKNILGLLEAYRALVSTQHDVPPLLLVGKRGWLSIETEQAIQAFQPAVIWREDIATDDLPAIYNGALVAVSCSFYEGFGLPVLEAMACGTATIVSNTSAFPELVGDVGLQIDPSQPQAITEAMDYVIHQDTWRHDTQQKAIHRAKTFTWAAGARIIHDTYQRLLATI